MSNLQLNFAWHCVQKIIPSLNMYGKPHSVTEIFEDLFGRTFLF